MTSAEYKAMTERLAAQGHADPDPIGQSRCANLILAASLCMELALLRETLVPCMREQAEVGVQLAKLMMEEIKRNRQGRSQ